MKTRNIYLLISLAFTAQSNTALSMNIIKGAISGLSSFTELFITSTPILGTMLDQTHPQSTEKLTDTQSMPPQSEQLQHQRPFHISLKNISQQSRKIFYFITVLK